MPRRFTIIQAPANPEDPDIANAMISKEPLRVPSTDEIVGYIREEDIADLAKRDRKTILALSVFEQWIDWQTAALVDLDAKFRLLDAEVARRKIEISKIKAQQTEEGWKWGIVKWTAVTIIATVLPVFFKWLFGIK